MSDWTPANVGMLISAISAAVIAMIGAWKMAKIEAHVNSEKTALVEQAVAKDTEITLLREMLADRKITAALLAQDAAGAVVTSTSAPVLDRIETNTAETADSLKESLNG